MQATLRLTNFKGIAGPSELPIRPLTLVFGANSSGKTSVLQSLLLLKQSFEASEQAGVLLPTGSLVNLGGFRELVYGHDLNRSLKTALIFPNPAKARLLGREGYDGALGVEHSFRYDEHSSAVALERVEIFVDDLFEPAMTMRPRSRRSRLETEDLGTAARWRLETNPHHPYVQRLYQQALMDLLPRALPAIRAELSGLQNVLESFTRGQLRGLRAARDRSATTDQLRVQLNALQSLHDRLSDYDEQTAQQDMTEAASILPVTVFDLCPGARLNAPYRRVQREQGSLVFGTSSQFDPVEYFASRLAVVVSDVGRRLRSFLEGIAYLGPLREYPDRHYVYSGSPGSHVGKTGRFAPDVVFRDRTLVDRVSKAFKTFGLPYTLQIASPAHTPELEGVYALRLSEENSDINVSILDVGFGISQVLPVIVESYVAKGSTIIVEQPELHLHPHLQGELATLFAECVRPPYNNSFIIETHSEHLLLRMRRLIRENVVDADEVSVVVVERINGVTSLLPLRLDKQGRMIDSFPKGFFSPDLGDLLT